MSSLIREIEKAQMKTEIPLFKVGDTVEVHVEIVEAQRKEGGAKTGAAKDKDKDAERKRVHVFTGIVISRTGSGLREMFTVRRIVTGEGVERTFPLHSPSIVAIKQVRSGDVRRAKLTYLRQRVGKATKVKEKRSTAAVPGAEQEG